MKLFSKILLILVVFTITQQTVFAQDTVDSLCGSYGSSTAYFDTPPVTAFVCAGIRIMNFAFFLVGGVFVIMFLMGMYKYATAWGDPKGIQGAQQTVTNAVIGAIICFGAGTILLVTGNVVGLDQSFIGGINPFNKLIKGFCNLFAVAELNCDGTK
jgi:hypothetical protein